MSRIAEVTRQDGKIYQGATFYWEVTLYDDADHTQLTPMDGLTPVATLMTPKGVLVAPFSCSFLDATATKPKRIAMVLPKAITAECAHGTRYLYNLDLRDSGGECYRKLAGELEAERGQVTE